MRKLFIPLAIILALIPLAVFAVSAPAIVSLPASNVKYTTARLNSVVLDDGSEDCDVRFGYGTTTQTAGNFDLYDTVTGWVSGYNTYDSAYLDVSSLTAGTPYFFRVQIKNSDSTVTSVDEQTFTTENSVDDMATFNGIPTDTTIKLSWVKGDGASNSLINFRVDTYPTTTSDGTTIYTGTDSTYTHTGLTAGTTYYYSIWGYSGATYSSNELNLAMTTLSVAATSGNLPDVATPSNWFQDPDETPLAKLQPFYSVINGFADSWGMPRENMWLGLSLIIVLIIGVGLYIKFRAPALALIVMSVVMGAFVTLGLLPTFMIFVVILLALGGWVTRPQGV